MTTTSNHTDRPEQDAAAPTPPLLLVAEPDERLGRELALALAGQGMEVTVCADGAEALLRTGALHPDGLLVSAAIEPVDAVTFVRTVRTGTTAPIILGVGEGDAELAIRALAAGATLCVARPYRFTELLPVVKSIRAGQATAAGEALTCGPIKLDPSAHLVLVAGEPVHLPLREFELLRYLMLHAGRVVTRDQIQAHVWHSGKATTNTITVHIRRLRTRLGDDPDDPRTILTVRGIGYRMVDGG